VVNLPALTARRGDLQRRVGDVSHRHMLAPDVKYLKGRIRYMIYDSK
jgi:hypothetical protein